MSDFIKDLHRNLIAKRSLGSLFQSISTGKRMLTSRSLKKKFLGFDHTRKRTRTILSVQETKSWDVPKMYSNTLRTNYGDGGVCPRLK